MRSQIWETRLSDIFSETRCKGHFRLRDTSSYSSTSHSSNRDSRYGPCFGWVQRPGCPQVDLAIAPAAKPQRLCWSLLAAPAVVLTCPIKTHTRIGFNSYARVAGLPLGSGVCPSTPVARTKGKIQNHQCNSQWCSSNNLLNAFATVPA